MGIDPMTAFGARAGVAVGGLLIAALAISPLAAAPAPAAPQARAQQLQQLLDCRKLTDGPARLACYDKAAAAFDQAEAKGDVVVVDREQAQKVRKQAFGFTLPSLSLFDRGVKPEEINSADGKIASAHRNRVGKWVIVLEDGATWVQVDAEEIPIDPKPGQPVKIRKASLGSYLFSVGNQRAFKAHRVEGE
jgi:hypothetical protein